MTGSLLIGLALSPTWLRGASWRRPDSGAEEMFALPGYARIALAADEAGLDFLFAPDAPRLDVSALDHQPGFSTLDSHTLVSALVGSTRRIGLVPTVHTLFDAPYAAARRVQSLRQLAGNRIGWNVVTALGGAENFGRGSADPRDGGALLADSASRYERAAEFVSTVAALLRSYPAEAVRLDRRRGVFAHRDAVRPIHHTGRHFSVEGPLGTPAPPGPLPPVFQAGGSEAGVRFAGSSADAVFAAAPTVRAAREVRGLVRAAAAAHRDPDAVAVLPGLALTLADTREEAERLHDTTAGARHWSVVGTPDDAVREIEAWRRAGAIDGFIALPSGSRRSIDLFLERVLPRLEQRRMLRLQEPPGGAGAQEPSGRPPVPPGATEPGSAGGA